MLRKRRPSVGLALGGGGARGLAHIGVLRVLEREHIPIDYLSGTSMGGVLAALFASGMNSQQLEQEAEKMNEVSFLLKLIDFEIPERGLLKGGNLSEYLAGCVGSDQRFEDLPIKLGLTAVDIRRGIEVTMISGRLVPAVQATMALPGMVDPVEIGNHLLVDGGVLNNVPADVVREMGAELVIAVDVSPDVHDPDLWENMKIPSFSKHRWRTSTITIAALTEARLEKARPEFILRPNLSLTITTITGFNHADEIIAAGIAAAEAILPELRKELRPSLRFGKTG
ncbi:MAG: patatin-like phospholipase family protein [Anaerolineales bacterium]|nr:patatin-like phospholipase family protein [Anaerolineales bacterium]